MNRRRQDDIPISPVRITFGAFMRAATTRLTDEQIIVLIHQLEAELLSRAARQGRDRFRGQGHRKIGSGRD